MIVWDANNLIYSTIFYIIVKILEILCQIDEILSTR